jgi:hypothetical protein
MVRSLLAVAGCVALASTGCSDASASASSRGWVQVGRDGNYIVWIDTSRLTKGRFERMSVYGVWYRTDHAVPRLQDGKPFNREIVHSVVQCDSLWFRVSSVDMSLDGGRPISMQRSTINDLRDQPWRRVQLGTVEEAAAQAACHFGKRHSAGNASR